MTRELRIERFGAEGEPVVIVDDWLADPRPWVDLATYLPFDVPSPFYPGVRAALPATELPALFEGVADILRDVFGHEADLRVTECNYSLVTTRPEELAPIQRLPHFDGVERGRIAALLYLCPEDHGGTAFFRHRSTGYETVDETRHEAFRARLHAEVGARGLPPAAYVGDDDPLFETIGTVPARFNRMAIYRGVTLHCARIGPGCPFVADPRAGRLTLNGFLAPKA